MKKLLPLFLFLAGALVLGAVFFFIAKSTKETPSPEEVAETAPETPLADRPIASLTPSADGHWLTMSITKIKIAAKSLDYTLLYSLPDGRSQGVPGSVSLAGTVSIERKLLLGSESSGKYRYDEGVQEGTLTLKFRDDSGKLVAKLSTPWHLQGAVSEVTSTDGNFKVRFKKAPAKTFFVTMSTFGLPADSPAELVAGPWGVFSSSKTALSGTPQLSGATVVYRYSGGKWTLIKTTTPDLGIFIGTK